MKVEEVLLPIGSVVLLENGKKTVMITGFFASVRNSSDKIYDYCGCPYPEGTIKSDLTLMFDHNQIVQVLHKGLVNDEHTGFIKGLFDYISSSEVDEKIGKILKEKINELTQKNSSSNNKETPDIVSQDNYIPLFESNNDDTIDVL